MPVTPFHLGPGLLLKGLAPRALSMTAFTAANVAIDLESVVNLLAGRHPVHATLHTLPVALGVGVVCGVATAAVARRLGRTGPALRLGPCLVGGVLGGLGQTVLDAVMHRDLLPFRPLSDANPFLGAVPLDVLHLGCVVAGVVGAALWAWRRPPSGGPARPETEAGGPRVIRARTPGQSPRVARRRPT